MWQPDAEATELLEGSANEYVVLDGDSFSVFCTTNEEHGVINRMDFSYNEVEHTEWQAEWFMGGNSDTYIGRIDYLKEDCDTVKSFSVSGKVWTGECFSRSFQLTPTCG